MKRQRNTTQMKEQTRNTKVQINAEEIHRNLECQVHESRQIGSRQTRDGKSERPHFRNQRTKMDWNG